MKNFKIYLLTLFSLFLIGTVSAQTADEIIEKYADAIGGRTAISAVKSVKTVGSMSMMGMDFPFTMYATYPDKSYLEVSLQGMMMKQGCDGTTGWMVNPMGGQSDPEKVDDETANGFKVRGKIFGPLLYYKDDGASAELVGIDTLNGKTAYKIKYVGPDKQDQYFYFDTENNMLVRMDKKVKAMGKTVHSETTYANYKTVGDVSMPFLMEVKSSEMKMGSQEMIIDKVEINPELDPSIYTMPVK